MRFTLTVPAFLALVSSAFAQSADFDPVTVPTSNQIISAGAPFTVQWTAPAKYAAGTISIELIGGATQGTQQPLGVIATGIQNSAGSFTWNVPSNLGDDAFYGFVVKLESNPAVFQYSNPFHIKAGAVSSAAPPAKTSAYGGLPPSDTTTITTSTGVKTVTLASQTTSAAVITSAPYAPPPAVTDVTVLVNATTTVPCRNSTIAVATLTGAPTTLQSATRLPPPPPSSPIWAPPGQAQTTTVVGWAAPSGTAAPSNPVGSAPLPIPTGAGARVGGSSLALVASLVVAYFAL
ncbi:hypothetical protein ACHAQJ_002889 [Trichoderma viride]